VIFSSGEAQVLDIEKAKDGALVRAIDISIRASDFGSEDSTYTKVVADTITATVRNNYGFMYWAVIHLIISREEYILEQIDRYKRHFVEMAEDDLSKRLALTFAVIAACGDLMLIAIQKLSGDATLLSVLDPVHITASIFRDVMDTLHQKNDRHSLALDTLKQNLILDEDGKRIINDHKLPIGIVDKDIWYVISKEVNKILGEMEGVVPIRFFRWAEEAGYIYETDREKGRYTKTKKINGTSVKTYAFNFSVKNAGNTGNDGNGDPL
jgi:hypothetical protein